MKFHYYPGCSLEASAREYGLSTRALMQVLGVELTEIPGWTCCGASAAEAVSELLSLSLAARNLSLAARAAADRQILVPCSACYLNLKRVERRASDDERLKARLNEVLEVEGLALDRTPTPRHLLDVVSRDIGAEPLRENRKRRLDGLRIAPYYGCQCLRPYRVFDDPEAPRSMEALITATGAEVYPFAMAARCCGASHMNTKTAVGLQLVAAILDDARGADAVVTVCPMCQMNLEAYQRRVSRVAGRDLAIPVLYLPQLLGLALGLAPVALGLDLNLAVPEGFIERVAA